MLLRSVVADRFVTASGWSRMSSPVHIDRRRFLQLTGAGVVFVAACSSTDTTATATRPTVGPTNPAVAAAEASRARPGASVTRFDLRAAPATLDLGGRRVDTWAYDGGLPGPELRVTEGDVLEVALRNDLPEATTIHWHGVALRNDMDGVPDLTGVSVDPGESFTYRFTVPDAGTYWFHPHMGLQLDRGLYAPLVVEERSGSGRYDVDQVVVFDDWLDGVTGTPEDIYARLAGMSSMGGSGDMDGMSGMGGSGMGGSGGQGGMGMYQSDLLGGDAGDVGYPLHLLNGRTPSDPPTIRVPSGGTARLRLINAGSDTSARVISSSRFSPPLSV